MDGTQYFSSGSISCKGCLRTKFKESKNFEDFDNAEDYDSCEDDRYNVNFSHRMVQIAIMHPNLKQVLPLMPETISNTDGITKQDCEINAAKRLVPKLRKDYHQLGLIFGGDDLYSRQPIIQEVLSANAHYIFVAKPTSHKYLNEYLSTYPELQSKSVLDQDGTRHLYRWMNSIPLHGGTDAVITNYFSYQMIRADKKTKFKEIKIKEAKEKTKDKAKEQITYTNSWVTDLELTEENIVTMVKAGRCRWKIENECFNTLKNQGYCIDHSYGHGDKNLCSNFYLLTLIAFVFHQVFELTDKLYQECRCSFGSKKHLWEALRIHLRLFVFATWEVLLEFSLNPEDYNNSDRPIKRSYG